MELSPQARLQDRTNFAYLTSFSSFHCTRQLAGPFRIQELSYPSGAHLSDVIDGDMTFKLSIDEGCYCSANTLDLNQLAANDTDC